MSKQASDISRAIIRHVETSRGRNALKTIGLIAAAEEDDGEEVKKKPAPKPKDKKAEDSPLDAIIRNMAHEAAKTFFESTIDSAPKADKLTDILVPLMEKGLISAFKNKGALNIFLENVGIIKEV